MIASLCGIVLSVGLTSAVIETSGVGMSTQATLTTLFGLRADEKTPMHTEMMVHEDSPALLDFADADKRDSFRTLMSAKGIGTKLTLAVLTVHTPNALRRAIASQDVATLTRIPGLGFEGIQRVIPDVTDKLDPVTGDNLGATQTVVQNAQRVEVMSDGGPEPHMDVVATLVQFDWNEANTQQTVSSVTVDTADGGQEPDMVAVLRASLGWLEGRYRD